VGRGTQYVLEDETKSLKSWANGLYKASMFILTYDMRDAWI
jgi:hypothetical protein